MNVKLNDSWLHEALNDFNIHPHYQNILNMFLDRKNRKVNCQVAYQIGLSLLNILN